MFGIYFKSASGFLWQDEGGGNETIIIVSSGSILFSGNLVIVSQAEPTVITFLSGSVSWNGMIPTVTSVNVLGLPEYNNRCVLVEIDWAGSDQVIRTEYLSNMGYTTGGEDTPSNISYIDLILQAPVITSRIDSALQIGTLTIRNPMVESYAWLPSSLSPWLLRSWHGHGVRLFIGDPTWGRSEFVQFFSGVVESISVGTDASISFGISDNGLFLRDMITKHYGFYGKVFNMEPVYIGNGNSDTYRIDDIHAEISPPMPDDSVYEITQVRDNGSIVAFTAEDDKKTFELNIPPAGTVTVDAIRKGDYSAASVIYNIAKDAGIPDDNLDSALLQDAVIGVGYVVGQHESSNYMDIIQNIASSAGGYVQWNAAGKLAFYFINIKKAPVANIGIDDIVNESFEIQSIDDPLMYLKLGYKRNWKVQDYNSLAGIAQIDSSPFTVEYQYVVQDNGKTIEYPLPMTISTDTLIADETAAAEELSRRMIQRTAKTFTISLSCFNLLTNLKLGDNILLTYPKLDFDQLKTSIIGIALDPNSNTTRLTTWNDPNADGIKIRSQSGNITWHGERYNPLTFALITQGWCQNSSCELYNQNIAWSIDNEHLEYSMGNYYVCSFNEGYQGTGSSIQVDRDTHPWEFSGQYITMLFEYECTGTPYIDFYTSDLLNIETNPPYALTNVFNGGSGIGYINLSEFASDIWLVSAFRGEHEPPYGDGSFRIKFLNIERRDWHLLDPPELSGTVYHGRYPIISRPGEIVFTGNAVTVSNG